MKLPWYNEICANDPSFTSLHVMSWRKLGDMEWIDLFENISIYNTNLIELSIGGHELSNSILELLGVMVAKRALKDHPFKYMCFGSSNLGEEGFGSFLKGVKSVLKDSESVVPCLIDHLDLENRSLTEKCFELINSISNVVLAKKLNVSRNNISRIPTMVRGLQSLDLSACPLVLDSPGGIHSLLGPDSSLEQLILWDTQLSFKMLQLIAKCLSNNRKLKCFYYSPLRDQNSLCIGQYFFSSAECLSVDDLRFKGCKVDSAYSKVIGTVLSKSKITRLEMSSCDITSNVLEEILATSLESLEHFDLSKNKICSKSFEHISSEKLFNLKSLNFQGNQVTSTHSFSHESLQEFELSCNPLSLKDFEYLESISVRLPQLKYLGMGGVTDMFTDEKDQEYAESVLKELGDKQNAYKITF